MINFIEAWRRKRREQRDAKEQAEYNKLVNATYSRVFSTEDGKFVLEHLVKRNMVVSIAMKGDELIDIGERQGRANLVDEILQRIENDRNTTD